MVAVAALVYPHIAIEPKVMSGRPCIAGTRVRVMDIVAASRSGVPPEGLLNHSSSRPLALSEIYAALSYYYDHQEEMEAGVAEDSQLGLEAERDLASASR